MAVDELPRWWRGWHRRRSGNINLLIAIATGLLGIYICILKKSHGNSEPLFSQIDDRLSRRVGAKRLRAFLLAPTSFHPLYPRFAFTYMCHVYIELLIIMNNYLTRHLDIRYALLCEKRLSYLWAAQTIDYKLRRIIKSHRVAPLIFWIKYY